MRTFIKRTSLTSSVLKQNFKMNSIIARTYANKEASDIHQTQGSLGDKKKYPYPEDSSVNQNNPTQSYEKSADNKNYSYNLGDKKNYDKGFTENRGKSEASQQRPESWDRASEDYSPDKQDYKRDNSENLSARRDNVDSKGMWDTAKDYVSSLFGNKDKNSRSENLDDKDRRFK